MNSGDTTRRTRALLPFMALESATLLSGIGNGIVIVALPWLILERTGSATLAGTLAAITALPTMAAALFSGTIVDLVGRRLVSVVSDLFSLVAVALIPILDATVGLSFAGLAVLAVFGAVFDPAGVGARESMLPEAADAAHIRLSRANGIHEAVWGAAFLLGPGLGGLLIAWVGAASTFWSTAVMFAMSALVMIVVAVPGAGKPAVDDKPEGMWSGTKEGLQFLWRDRPQRALAVLMMALVMLYLPVEAVVFPVHFESLDQPGSLGLVLMALSAGGIVGALSFGWLTRRFTMYRIFLAALTLTSVAFVPMVPLPALYILLPCAALVGLAFGPVQPILNTVMQTRTPSRLRGRVVGLQSALQYAAGPIGYLAVGPIVDNYGVVAAMAVVALGFFVVTAIAFLWPVLRQIDQSAPDGAPPQRPHVEDAPPPRPG